MPCVKSIISAVALWWILSISLVLNALHHKAHSMFKSTGMTSTDFCEKLVYTKKVAVVPGDAFGECGEGYVRVSYAYSLNHLREAIKRIGEFLEDIKNGNVQ